MTTFTSEPTAANDPDLSESMRAHWAKCQARAERYEEELTLTLEEMGRTLRYFEWKRNWWLSLQSQQELNSTPPADVQRGLRAYAHPQAAVFDNLISSFAKQWRKTLLSHNLNPAWLSCYPSTIDPQVHSHTEASPKSPISPSPLSFRDDAGMLPTNGMYVSNDDNSDSSDGGNNGNGGNNDDEYLIDDLEAFEIDLEDKFLS
jgi:hypothetical protein